jgi:hypothetical protein
MIAARTPTVSQHAAPPTVQQEIANRAVDQKLGKPVESMPFADAIEMERQAVMAEEYRTVGGIEHYIAHSYSF